jgi:hypothetical protein
MSSETPDATTEQLVANAARSRARVASDVEELARELTLPELKDRALDAAERSVESIAARALRRLLLAPQRLVVGVRQHPIVGVAIAAGAALVIWRIAARRDG